MFHAADGTAYSSQLSDGMLINSLVQGADIRINKYTVNGKQVSFRFAMTIIIRALLMSIGRTFHLQRRNR